MTSFEKEHRLPILTLVLFFSLLVIRNAWISDDAFITFRSIENFLAGYGMGINPNIRVQSFTHPLWMLMLSMVYFPVRLLDLGVSSMLAWITILVSLLFSLLTLWLLLSKLAKQDSFSLFLPALVLGLSGSFIDYSTSGLENPLTHLLLVVFIWIYLLKIRNLFILSVIASMLVLTRMDLGLIIGPAIIFAWWNSGSRLVSIRHIAIGFLPVVVWLAFSLFYFGFPFPNSAYAKLNTGIQTSQLIQQGLDYLLNSINWEPLTLFTIGFAGFSVYIHRDGRLSTLFLGILIYLVYIVRIGGDFMSGRFLTPLLLGSTALVASQRISRRTQLTFVLVVLLFGIFSHRSPLWGSNMVLLFPDYPIGDRNFISDQRLYYFGNPEEAQFNSFVENGFKDANLGSDFAGTNWIFTGIKKVLVLEAMGRVAYEKGPNFYVVDVYALADPLLARLPVQNKYWQIGHFRRDLPEGYYDTLETGENRILDPDLSLYYSKLNVLMKSPLRDTSRLVEVWKFNTGQYDYLIRNYVARQSN